MGRVGHGGRGAYVMTPELARAVRAESEATICHWWGVCKATAGKWRRRLGVGQFNGGTRHLWSLWKPVKLPDKTVAFSPGALRTRRLALGLFQRQVATAMGWNTTSAYDQMESGRRRRAAATPEAINVSIASKAWKVPAPSTRLCSRSG